MPLPLSSHNAERQHRDTIVDAIADAWSGKPCYLDGAPAKVSGRLLRFAIIAPLDPSVGAVEYSWHTVNRIMRERGGFFSR